MAFTQMTQTLAHISALPDQPRLEDGFTPAAIKQSFDQAGQDIQTFLNETHLPELAAVESGGSGAEQLGSAPVDSIPAGSVHAQLCALKALCDDNREELAAAADGIVPDQSISIAKLDAVTQNKINESFARDLQIVVYRRAGEYTFCVPKTGTYRLKLCGAGAGGSFCCETLYEVGHPAEGERYSGRGGASGAYLETFLDLTQDEEYPITVGCGGTAARVDSSPVGATLTPARISYYLQTILPTQGTSSVFGNLSLPTGFYAMGGSNRVSEISTSLSNSAPYPVFVHYGTPYSFRPVLSEHTLRFELLSDGARSLIGRGGSFTENSISSVWPSFGGGGHGGVLLYQDGNFIVERNPISGGDGLVLLEYLG